MIRNLKLCTIRVGHAGNQLVNKFCAVRESANKSAASAASLDYVKFQAVIKSAASAASLRGDRACGRLDHDLFFAIFGRTGAQKNRKNEREIAFLCLSYRDS